MRGGSSSSPRILSSSARGETDIGCSRGYIGLVYPTASDAATPITWNPPKTRTRRTIPLIRGGINNPKCELFQLGFVVAPPPRCACAFKVDGVASAMEHLDHHFFSRRNNSPSICLVEVGTEVIGHSCRSLRDSIARNYINNIYI